LQEYRELAGTYKLYTDAKIAESKFDFGDLILLTIKLFREKPNVLKMYRDKFKYVLVDEFQDTNYTQNVLVNLLVDSSNLKAKRNLTVVGDDDQAIYKFRGAAISNILHFNETYQNATKIVLTDNYRSRQEILDASYNLITHNNPHRLEATEQIDKKLRALGDLPKTPIDPIQLLISDESTQEADNVAKEILKLVGEKTADEKSGSDMIVNSIGQAMFLADDSLVGENVEASKNAENSATSDLDTAEKKSYSFRDIAILVRANDHSEEFIQSLRFFGIPYKFTGPKGLYTRPEISPLISFFKIIANYTNEIEMFNLLRMPIWKISPREISELLRFSKEQHQSSFETLESLWGVRLGETEGNPPAKNEITYEGSTNKNLLTMMFSKESIASISNLLMLLDYSLQMVKAGSTPGEILYMFIKESGYLAQFTEDVNYQNEVKVQNISKYFETLKTFEKENASANVLNYVDYLEYSIEIGDSPSVEKDMLEDLDAVSIMSVHKSKGLEFPVIFLVNLVSDRFPSRNMPDKLPIPDALIKDKLSTDDESLSHLEEERRLFYVGATRAKERLYLTASKIYTGNKLPKKASIFFSEILSRDVSLEDEAQLQAEKAKLLESDVDPNVIDTLGADLHLRFMPVDDLVEFNDVKQNLGTKFSYSQLNSFESCPKQYRYKYVLGLPGPKSPTLAFGRSIHNTLRTFYESLKNFKEGIPGFYEAPTVEMLIEAYYAKWINEGYESKKHEQTRKEQGEEMLRNYFVTNYSIEESPIELEKSISYKINDILMKGQVDRIDLVGVEDLPDGTKRKIINIVDYKTGKVKDKKAVEDDLQLSLYAIALEQFNEYRVESASLVFVEHNEIVSANVSQKNKDKVKERVIELVGDIRKGLFLAKPNFFMCKFCDYKSICSDAAV
jgi:DNA helicase II / ATP-dependent DNA helicase PcrA